MPIYSTETFSKRELTQANDGKWSAKRTFVVIGAKTEFEAMYLSVPAPTSASDPVPQINWPHPERSNLLVAKVNPKQQAPQIWEVAVDYETFSSGQGGDNPLTDPPNYEWQPGNYSDEFDHTPDPDNFPILNSARQPFDSNPKKDFATLFVTCSRNLVQYDPRVCARYQNTCNNDLCSISGFTFFPGQLCCKWIKPEAYKWTTADPPAYVKTSFHFEIRWGDILLANDQYDGFYARLLDIGTSGMFSPGQVSGTPVSLSTSSEFSDKLTAGRITDANGKPVTKPVRLNGYGIPLDPQFRIGGQAAMGKAAPPPGAFIEEAPNGTAVWLRYRRYEELPLSPLLVAMGF